MAKTQRAVAQRHQRALDRSQRNAARAWPKSTGTAPSAPTCATGSPTTAPSCRRRWWAMAAGPLPAARGDSVHRPERVDGGLGGVFQHLRRGHGQPACRGHQLVVFDTAVVDLTEQLQDPVDLLFGVQLGGGTDINGAVGYCQGLIQEPRNTILVLISDLYEGGVEAGLLLRQRAGGVGRAVHHPAGAERRGVPPPTTAPWPPSWLRWACPACLHARCLPRPDGRRHPPRRHQHLGRRAGIDQPGGGVE